MICEPVQFFVIDAYCHLSDSRDPGLGDYLSRELTAESIVIGVAKNRYRDTAHAYELLRGASERPLFITSIGTEYDVAAEYIKSMAGDHRIPLVLKTVDQLSRSRK